jgi:hypothetical protein
MRTYEEFMKKAHGALILERENEIILELRATRDYLDNKIDSNHEDLTARFDTVDIRLSSVESKIDKLENKVDSIGTQLSEVLTLLKK